MARELTSEFIDELLASEKQPIILYEGVFNTGTIRLWTGVGNINWNGSVWTGAGTFGTITPIDENSSAVAGGIKCSLAGLDSSLLPLVLSEVRTGQAGRVWVGFMNNTGAIIADPSLAFIGRLDVPSFEDNADNLVITISYESRLRDLEVSREFRYTDQSQRALFPEDKGFEYVASLQDWNGVWGKS